jgi:TIR domain
MEEIKYFFSYMRKDSEFVLKLAKELRAVGTNLWLDQLDILGGQRWDRAVEEALETCQGMIAVLSPESLASNNVMDEVSYALEEGKLIVPILLRPCNIPFRLRRVQHIDFTTDYDSGFSQLLRALRIEQPSQQLQPAPLQSTENIEQKISRTTETASKQTQGPIERLRIRWSARFLITAIVLWIIAGLVSASGVRNAAPFFAALGGAPALLAIFCWVAALSASRRRI